MCGREVNGSKLNRSLGQPSDCKIKQVKPIKSKCSECTCDGRVGVYTVGLIYIYIYTHIHWVSTVEGLRVHCLVLTPALLLGKSVILDKSLKLAKVQFS